MEAITQKHPEAMPVNMAGIVSLFSDARNLEKFNEWMQIAVAECKNIDLAPWLPVITKMLCLSSALQQELAVLNL